MSYKVGVVKKITFLFMTMALAVALVACQGAVGKTGDTGEPGPPGPPGTPPEPVNLAPIPTPAFQPLMLMDEGAAKTVDVEPHFHDPEGETLTFDASAAPAGIVDVSRAGSVLTVTPVAAGEAVITVTATDPKGAVGTATINVTVTSEGIMYVGTLDTSVALTPGQQHMIDGARIEMSFEEDEGETLSFSVSSSDSAVAMAEIGDDNMVTITALDAVGSSADVTITAMDDEGETDEVVITVSVVASLAPQASDMAPDPVSLTAGGDVATVNASDYFSDPAGDDLDYNADSSDDTVATADEADGVVTIMPVSSGSATVTITATNSRGLSAMQTVDVTVMAAPVAMPTVSDDIEDVLFQSPDAAAQTIMLSDHFTGATEYSPSSSNTAVATATEAGGVLTVTPVGAGSALVTVTASNARGMVSDEFNVNVLAAAMVNQPPMLKSGMTIGPFKRQTNNSAAPEEFTLSTYFEDPDGNDALLTYEVKQDKEKESPDTAGQSVIAVGGELWLDDNPSGTGTTCAATPSDTDDGTVAEAIPDGTDLGDDVLKICYQNHGTAEIEITAIDVDGMRSDTVTVVITVAPNQPPAVPTITGAVGDGEILDYIGAVDTTTAGEQPKLKINQTVEVLKGVEFNKYFADPDLGSLSVTDMLTFEVMFFTALADNALHAVVTGDAATAAAIKEADEAVEVTMTPMTWSGDPKAKFTLSVTGRKGTQMGADAMNQVVAIVATDTAGQKFARTFSVGVNHNPMAHGAQAAEKDRKTLSGETGFQNLIVPATEATVDSPTATVNLVQAGSDTVATAGGYFSDGDGPADIADGALGNTTGCVIKSTGGTDEVAAFRITESTAGAVDMVILAKAVGTKTVTISCTDTFGVESPSDTLTVKVIGSETGSRQ